MTREAFAKAVALAEKVGHTFVATADERGWPHLASAGEFEPAPEGRVRVTEWFCPGTMRNLEQNPHVALVIWDAEQDRGYQLLGQVEEVRDLSMLDGLVFGEGTQPPVPQVERALLVRVDRIFAFSQAPHSDVAL